MASNICSRLKISEQIDEENSAITSMVPAQDDDAVFSPAEQLPDEMLYQIFKNVDKISKFLKNYRLVCTTWRNTIDNNSNLFKLLIFTIVDIKQFLDTSLPSKVKSVRFIQPLKGTEEDFEDFFIKIGSTVEEIVFNFGADINRSSNSDLMHKVYKLERLFSPTLIQRFYKGLFRLTHLDKFFDFVRKICSTAEHAFLHFSGGWSKAKKVENQNLMFSMMLRYCTRLTSLTITIEDDHNYTYEFLKDCTEDPRHFVALPMIQSLTVSVRSKYLEDVKKFIFGLPNLRYLDLNCDELLADIDFEFLNVEEEFIKYAMQIHDMILEYLERYNGKLQEISLEGISELDDNILVKLCLSVGKMYPNTKIKSSEFDLNFLIDFENTEDIQVNRNNCQPIQAGTIFFLIPVDEPMNTDRIGLCSNLNSLEIIIGNNNWPFFAPNKLAFLQELTKLRELRIKRYFSRLENEESTILSAINSFACEFPSVITLDLVGDGLGVNYVPFQDCFPNVAKLCIRNLTCNINVDFIYNLTNLDQLRCLTLQNIKRLTDEHLTQVYDYLDENNKISQLPAIAGFKSLKHLQIIKCDQLTDKCLINGLALCNKMDKITLWQKKGKFTKCGFNYLQHARNFSVDDSLPTNEKYNYVGLGHYLVKELEFKKFTVAQLCPSPASRSSNKLQEILDYFKGTGVRNVVGAIIMLIIALLFFIVY